MKQLITVFVVAALLISCEKASKNPLAKKMNGIEFTSNYKFELPFLDYGNGASRSNKPKANAVVLSVTEDLILSGSVECTTSADAQWGGIQKFLALPLDNAGAVSYCNYYDPVPSPMVCPTSTSGVYRGWTSGFNYDVHLSNTVTIP